MLDQKLYMVNVKVFTGRMQWPPSMFVLNVRICSVFEQQMRGIDFMIRDAQV